MALRAAADEAELSPAPGQWMTGFALRDLPAEGTHDPILARALLLDDGAGRLAIVVCDLLGLAPESVARIRGAVAAAGTMPGERVLIACTHTHSGPACMPMRGALGHVDEGWLQQAEGRIAGLVTALAERLEPAQLAWGRMQVKGIGYNRQDEAHPIDTELLALAAERPGGESIATLLSYATHAVVLGPENRLFSGDWPGAAARALAQLRGGVGLCLQGTCGDVDPVVNRDRGWGSGRFRDAEQIGARLARAGAQALERAARRTDVQLQAASRTVAVPLDPPPALDALAIFSAQWHERRVQTIGRKAAEMEAEAMLAWAAELRQALAEERVPATLAAEVWAARIGEVRLVGLPFEPYSDIGLAIKQALAPAPVLVVGYANGLYGYCPTNWAKDQGGYGADSSYRWFSALLTAVGYGAAEALVEAAVSLLRERLPTD